MAPAVDIRNLWALVLVHHPEQAKNLGPVVQSVVSLTSSFMVKMLTVLVSTISNAQACLLNKNE